MLGLLLQDGQGPDQGEAGVDQGGKLPAEQCQYLERYPPAHTREVKVLFHRPTGAAALGRYLDGHVPHRAQPCRHQFVVVRVQGPFDQLPGGVAYLVCERRLCHRVFLSAGS